MRVRAILGHCVRYAPVLIMSTLPTASTMSCMLCRHTGDVAHPTDEPLLTAPLAPTAVVLVGVGACHARFVLAVLFARLLPSSFIGFGTSKAPMQAGLRACDQMTTRLYDRAQRTRDHYFSHSLLGAESCNDWYRSLSTTQRRIAESPRVTDAAGCPGAAAGRQRESCKECKEEIERRIITEVTTLNNIPLKKLAQSSTLYHDDPMTC